MNERKPTWTCPVCDSKALYDNLLIDGYFQDVIKSERMPKDDNEIILEEVNSQIDFSKILSPISTFSFPLV